jgi:hypothetical protein
MLSIIGYVAFLVWILLLLKWKMLDEIKARVDCEYRTVGKRDVESPNESSSATREQKA